MFTAKELPDVAAFQLDDGTVAGTFQATNATSASFEPAFHERGLKLNLQTCDCIPAKSLDGLL